MKKFTLALVCVILTLCLMLAACKVSSETLILNTLSTQSKNASSIEVKVTVKDNGVVVATEDVTYNITSGKKTVRTSVPNTDFTADSAWTVTETTSDIAAAGVQFDWKEASFSELVLENLTLTGKIANDSVKASLGIESTDVKGDVVVVITASGDLSAQEISISKVEVSYTSANGNAVTMVITTK